MFDISKPPSKTSYIKTLLYPELLASNTSVVSSSNVTGYWSILEFILRFCSSPSRLHKTWHLHVSLISFSHTHPPAHWDNLPLLFSLSLPIFPLYGLEHLANVLLFLKLHTLRPLLYWIIYNIYIFVKTHFHDALSTAKSCFSNTHTQ